jgi:hypothetical protein
LETVLSYIKPEFMVIVCALYVLGRILKQFPKIPNRWIPLILSGFGIFFAGVHIAAVIDTYQNFHQAVFDCLIQGILCSGMAVYAYELVKQMTNRK